MSERIQFTRRRFSHTCISPVGIGGAGLAITCVAAQVGGFVKNRLDEAYKGRFYALTDSLEHFAEIGLDGINSVIHDKI